MIPWLVGDEPFPDPESALAEPNGLLCGGGDLSPERILAGYRTGVFPWFSEGDPILWWSPDPRMVLFPHEFHVSHSLRRRLRHGKYEVRLDSAFEQVINACAATPRHQQHGTWISDRMQRAYTVLHELGIAHSVESWSGGTLVGGLYGVQLGRVFFGESMFSHATDASKVALAHLSRFLERRGFAVIDCQMKTTHLSSLGAREITRKEFRELIAGAITSPSAMRWPADAAAVDWSR